MIYFFLGEDYVFGSYIDWNSQHGVLPDYFRQKFYETGSLTGQFALELGGGMNPYALAYHGMLNPVLLPSYLFPHLNMYHYLIISGLMLFFLSLILLYLWMRQNRFSQALSFFSVLLLAFSGPFLFHFHKQVMFVDYFPFLLLALMGVDRLLLRRKKALFIISFTLALMTSFFYAVSLIVTVSVYFFYRYLDLHKGLRGHPIRHIGSFALSGLTACLLTCALTLPSFIAILGGRETNAHTEFPSLLKLFLPRISFSHLLYSTYGAGLNLLLMFALFALFFYKKPHATFLSAALLILWLFPICSFAMNAFLYDRGKAFITLLPLCLLAINLLIRDRSSLKIPTSAIIAFLIAVPIIAALFDRTYLLFLAGESILLAVMLIIWKQRKTPFPLCISSICILLILCIVSNTGERAEYLKKYRYEDFISPVKSELLSTYAKADSPTRITDLTGAWYTCNQTYGKNLLRASVYASSSNQSYLHLFHQNLCLTNPTTNKITIADVNNIFYATLMGQEWMIGWESTQMAGYEKKAQKEKWVLYRNQTVYTLGFSAARLMSLREFNTLSPADKQFALTGYAVVEDDSLPDVYTSPFRKLDIDGQIPLKKSSAGWRIQSDTDVKFSLSPNAGPNAIYAVRVKFEQMQDYHIYLTVNDIKNTFSGYNSAFPNDNSDLWYIISASEEIDTLNFTFSSGDYTASAIEVYAMDNTALSENRSQMTMMDTLNYDGVDTLSGSITLSANSAFLFTIPIADGFTLYIDGEKTPIEIIDTAFIGARLSAGRHEIVLTYSPPMQSAGLMLSGIGIGLLIGLILWDHRKRWLSIGNAPNYND